MAVTIRQRVLAAFMFGLAAGATGVGAQDIGIKVGAVAPDAEIETLDGKPVRLSSYLGKREVLLEFWATWCPNCEHLTSTIKTLRQTYGDRLGVVGITVSFNQSPSQVKRYVERHGLKHTILFDRSGDAGEAYMAPATSYVVLVGADGKVHYTGLGADQDLDRAVRAAFAAMPPAQATRKPAAKTAGPSKKPAPRKAPPATGTRPLPDRP